MLLTQTFGAWQENCATTSQFGERTMHHITQFLLSAERAEIIHMLCVLYRFAKVAFVKLQVNNLTKIN